MKSFVGLDIGFTNIKVVELGGETEKIQVLKAVFTPTPSRGLSSEAESDKEKLAATLKKLFKDSGIKNRKVNVALAEHQVFTRIVETPKLSEKELAQSLRWEAEQYIPLPLEEVNMDFAVIERLEDQEKMKVLLVASPLRLIEKYMAILEEASLEVKVLESESLALYRLFQNAKENVLVIDLGSTSTSFYLMKKEVLLLARTVPNGSAVLTKALTTDLTLPVKQAEEYKRTYGLNTTVLEGKVAAILTPLIDNLILEIRQNLLFLQEKYREEAITEILVTGGGVFLPGLIDYLKEKLQIPVSVANPWQQFTLAETVQRQFVNEETIFSVATGLAMRDL